MKFKFFVCIAAVAASALTACASPGMPDLAAAKAATSSAVSSEAGAAARLAALKEANRHVELCHRTYTLGWPFTGIIDCPAQNPNAPASPPAPLTAADVVAIVDAAIAKLTAAKPTP